jgi:Mg-chelatase subunit ChlD
MKKAKRHSSLFSLPILLSFNELAWILIFGMVLFCANIFLELKSTNTIQVKAQASRSKELDNERAKNNALLVMLSEQFRQLQSLTNSLHKKDEDLKRAAIALAEAQKNADSLMKETHSFRVDLSGLEIKLAQGQARCLELERELALFRGSTNQSNSVPSSESVVRQELLGLKGDMTNVIVLLDRSGSMKIGNRWNDALSVVDAWLRYLPIKRCAMITFSDQYISYPDTGLLSMIGNEGQTNRMKLIEQLQDLEPEGNTDTLSALKKAYSYENNDKADTIILFTDGAPYVPPLGNSHSADRETEGRIRFSKGQMEKVRALARSQPGIPINVVAIGNYYEENELTKFLINLAKETGGVFLGR